MFTEISYPALEFTGNGDPCIGRDVVNLSCMEVIPQGILKESRITFCEKGIKKDNSNNNGNNVSVLAYFKIHPWQTTEL